MTEQAAWALRVTRGPATGAELPLDRGQTVLGRVVQPGGIPLRDDSISRRHAVVTVDGGLVSIFDAGSTNGTSVNGVPLDGTVNLAAGDRILAGETEFVVVWRAPATPPSPAVGSQPSLQTILFTDLVGSTAMASRVGDAAAIEVLSVHDRIVRAAVAHNGGREVKHTGDGIMAAFPSAAGGVQAAIDMMRAIDRHNADSAAASFEIRVGLNAGEPVVSGGDLFGLAVSLAARVCNAAGGSEILVTEAVKVLCLGKGKRFVERGAQTFKGIEGPVSVCEVDWFESDEA